MQKFEGAQEKELLTDGLAEAFAKWTREQKASKWREPKKHIVLTASVRGETDRKVEGALYGHHGIERGRQTFCKRQESTCFEKTYSNLPKKQPQFV